MVQLIVLVVGIVIGFAVGWRFCRTNKMIDGLIADYRPVDNAARKDHSCEPPMAPRSIKPPRTMRRAV
jgi:hypothetical protein